MEPIYTKGETVLLHTDIFPGFVRPLPPGVPGSGTRKRVVVTERALSIAWSVAGRVQRVDIPLAPEDTANATLRGGPAGQYVVGRDEGCSSCGSGAIKSYKFWPGVIMKEETRAELAAQELKKDRTYGLPSVRYSRTRP